MRHFQMLSDLCRMAALSDEMELPAPPPPAEAGTGAPSGESFDSEIDADQYDAIPTTEECIPKGISECRADGFEKKKTTEGQPYFSVKWVVQQEPNVGRVIFDMIPWVKTEDVRDANDTSSPRNAEARSLLKKRLWKSKQLTDAARYKPQGRLNFETFLGTNPTVKIEHGVEERSSKTDQTDSKTGKPIYEKNGTFQAKVKKYLPLI